VRFENGPDDAYDCDIRLQEVEMTKVKMTERGTILLPKAVRDRRGFAVGTEFEIIDGGKDIVLKPVDTMAERGSERKLTVDEFLAKRVPYDGPPVTDEMMHEAINRAAVEDWARMERQWNDSKDD
jgi:AbrB family looped-hinge helix DNA binding protein